jgi:cation diffusion facilitator CzcD-associated flavoprotein CzcO
MPLDNPTDSRSSATQAKQVDVLVVGAGFAGLYLLHCLRKLGLVVRPLRYQ